MESYYSDYGSSKRVRRNVLMWLVDGVMTLLSVVAAVAMFLTLLVPYINPTRLWVLPLLGLGAPVVYVVTVILALYWIIRWRWLRAGVMLGLTILGFFKVSLFFRPEFRRNYGEESFGKGAFKVMTYNVRSFYNDQGQSSVDDVMNLIAEVDPDIVCLQEFNTRLARGRESFEKIGEKYEMSFFTRPHKKGDSIVPAPMCILSKYRILRSGEILSPRTSVWVDLRVGEDTLRVFNNHLLSTAINRSDDEFITRGGLFANNDTLRDEKVRSIFRRVHDNSVLRAAQVDSIATEIRSTRLKHIVCGDFNDTPMSYVYRTMAHGMKDAFSECGSGYSHTFRGFFNTLRIDFVLRSEGLEALSYEVLPVDFSDHRPVVVRMIKTTLN